MKIALFILFANAANMELYTKNCETCHGANLDGNGPSAPYLNPRPRNLLKDKFKFGDSVTEIEKTIKEGLPGTSMPPFGFLSDKERTDLAAWIHGLRNKQ